MKEAAVSWGHYHHFVPKIQVLKYKESITSVVSLVCYSCVLATNIIPYLKILMY